MFLFLFFFFFQAEDGIRDHCVTGVQTCALPISGDRVLIDDGLLELRVEEVDDSEVRCVVVVGGPISSHKGLNFPDSSLSIKGLTSKDVEDLRFGIEELHPDWIAFSFVRSGDEVREIKERIKEFGGSAP